MEAFRKACSYLLSRVEGEPSNPAAELAYDFLSLLAGPEEDPQTVDARRHLERLTGDPTWGEPAAFFKKALRAIEVEIDSFLKQDEELAERLNRLEAALPAGGGEEGAGPDDLIEAFWGFFCPQAVGVRAKWEERILDLRSRRTVGDLSLSSDPLERPAEEILFSANVLLTVPPEGRQPSELGLREEVSRGLEQSLREEQRYWYDHPVQIGTLPEQNEILHGLKGLSETLIFEKRRGNARAEDRLDVILSVSVTHPGLHGLARTYIEDEVCNERGIRDLDLYIFTEDDTVRLVEDFLCPAARRFGLEDTEPTSLLDIFGVDGPYARHYNFLKAAAALWQVVKNPGIRATFKIDLDQVFPEEQLVRETGASAFDLLQTSLWGAQGRDSQDRHVSLGMIAGALVNQGDISGGLFTPDVTLPQGPWPVDRWVFASQVPQALSTAAEMMARYGDQPLDGRFRCLSRIHVTGGTIGIRVDSLRRCVPFTLSCIGRAEDQAYLMSVLCGPESPYLRYVHVPGLIMRHDKHAFAGEAIRTAAAGKIVGDYERMLLFSHYAKALPWPIEETRACLDPFTGCFILPLPLATALICLTLRVLSLSPDTSGTEGVDPEELLRVGAHRLGPLVERFNKDPEWMKRSYEQEHKAWHGYYDILAKVEEEVTKHSADAIQFARKAEAIIEETRVST
jgi:hypothetical protein